MLVLFHTTLEWDTVAVSSDRGVLQMGKDQGRSLPGVVAKPRKARCMSGFLVT